MPIRLPDSGRGNRPRGFSRHTIPYRENEASPSIVFHARRWHGDPKAGDDAAALVWRPVEFVDSDEFAWKIPGLSDKLRHLGKR